MSTQSTEKRRANWGLGRWFWIGVMLVLLAVIVDVIIVSGIKPTDDSSIPPNQVPNDIGVE